jgi:hypothetical protein
MHRPPKSVKCSMTMIGTAFSFEAKSGHNEIGEQILQHSNSSISSTNTIAILRSHRDVAREMDFVAGLIFFCYNDYRTHVGDKGFGAPSSGFMGYWTCTAHCRLTRFCAVSLVRYFL